jgi:imidazole glycerol phosphate synthase subunit HisF
VLTKRIIACMDVRDGQVVKGVQFQQLRHAGDPAELAERYNVEGIDEVVVLDITATIESRQALARTINAVAHRIFLPLTDAARDAVEWAREAESRGAGEILLTSMDRDGTRSGFDCEMTAAVAQAVNIPVIASGGAGGREHFSEVFTRGQADAALAASIFHYADTSVSELKRYLRDHRIPVRL